MRTSTIVLAEPPELLTAASPDWPTSLADLPKSPLWLHRAGVMPDLSNAVAIVGTRFADEEALRFTTDLSGQLADSGRVIISGGARGSTRPPIAVRLAMDAVNRGVEMGFGDGCALEATLFGLVTATDDMKEGTRAFVEKRRPVFTGR